MLSQIMRSGYVALLGKPNAGKSTLLNRLLEQKLAIVSDKPQTTRRRLLGIVNLPEAQLLLLDTPGINQHSGRGLESAMQLEAWRTLEDADAALLVVDALQPDYELDALIAARLEKAGLRCVAALNKIDVLDQGALSPLIEQYRGLPALERLAPISALTGSGVDELLSALQALLPEGPALFPRDQLTDVSERFVAAEIVREKVFEIMRQEIPYSTAVLVTRFSEPRGETDRAHIEADIWIERDSQKGMLIGAGGQMIKRIGIAARLEIEKALGYPVVLKLFVKVKPKWTRDPQALKELGYGDS